MNGDLSWTELFFGESDRDSFLEELSLDYNDTIWMHPATSSHPLQVSRPSSFPHATRNIMASMSLSTSMSAASSSPTGSNTASPDSRRHAKRLSPAVADEQLNSPPKRRVSRTERLHTLDNFTAVLSAGDEDALYAFLAQACCPNVIFTSNAFQEIYTGVKSVFFFWLLLIMMYPDITINMLDKRIFSPDREGEWLDETSGVEYVYKFAGTPVFHTEVAKVFAHLMRMMPDPTVALPTKPSTRILAYLQELICTKSVSDESHLVVKHFLAEISLNFNANNKIVRWSFGLLTTNKI
eukprot:gene32696-39529_t